MAAGGGDDALRRAVAERTAPDLTGTPFVYYLMGSWPGPYSRGLAWFRAGQFAAFVLAVFLLLRPLASRPLAGAVALVTAAACDPLVADMAVGNLSAWQLFGLVGAAVVLEARPRPAATGISVGWWLPPLLVLLTLLKPIVAAATGLLGLALLCREQTSRGRWRAIATAAAATALFAVLPTFLFGSTSLWQDWWSGTFSSSARLSYDIAAGNYSGVSLLAKLTGLPVGWTMGMIALALATSLAAVLLARGRGRPAGPALDLVADPLAGAALGIIALLALSPLVWSHYQVLAVLPALWLCRIPGWRWAGWLVLLLVVDVPRRLYYFWPEMPLLALDLVRAGSWIPLWIGALGALAGRPRAVPGPLLSAQPQSPPS